MYPNPAKDFLFVSIKENDSNVLITNLSGVVVYQNSNAPKGLLKVNLNKWESGVYFVRINNNAKKLIIE
ncbi:MAG: T9SS type A sorting domain-containing protein [Bacteroidota bacterium]|nr:T9SS type A sorting domain-containing protein [Bacteroidota bacterium]